MENYTDTPNSLNLRQKQELREHKYFSPYASFSDASLGRDRYEEPCDIRTIYQRDRDRIIHCKSFRRLKQKTQVFLAPNGDHYRTRLTHTLEVSQIARTIARSLELNEDLTEAIALGHDLGHTPFGHAGERALDQVCADGFCHHLQSIRVVELLEKHGQGLNLTKEVRDGIKNHQTKGMPKTLEGKVVRLCDKIAYINHDIDDAIRGKIIREDDIPEKYRKVLGYSVKERLNCLIHDIVHSSEGQDDILMSEEIKHAMFELRAFMFESVYTNPIAKGQEGKAEHLIINLYEYYLKHIDLLPADYIELMEEKNQTKERTVCDYIAGMTDRFAITKFQELFVPKFWNIY